MAQTLTILEFKVWLKLQQEIVPTCEQLCSGKLLNIKSIELQLMSLFLVQCDCEQIMIREFLEVINRT